GVLGGGGHAHLVAAVDEPPAHGKQRQVVAAAPGRQQSDTHALSIAGPLAVGRERRAGQALASATASIWQITVPALTVSPTAAASPWMRPARCATSGCSIFIASSTTTRSPSAISSPSSTATFTIVPCIGEASAFPPAAPPAARCPLRREGLLFGLRLAPPPMLSPAGSTTSSRFPPTSTTTRSTDSSSATAGALAGAGEAPPSA